MSLNSSFDMFDFFAGSASVADKCYLSDVSLYRATNESHNPPKKTNLFVACVVTYGDV